MALQPGDVIDGKYRIVRAIGQGGMGAVYEAEHGLIHRRVAIKTLHPAIASDAGVVQRFEREAQAAGRIGNDHILEVLDIGSLPDGSRYLVMEFLNGEPLTNRIKRFGKLAPREIVPLAKQILAGLDAAHAAGIVHRDLKPDNVFVLYNKAGYRDFVKLIDFGISKFQNTSGDSFSMTKTGAVMGTPYYMSPEQAAGTSVLDLRADLYAVGVILYEAATGRVPFHAETFNQLIIKIALSDAPSPKLHVADLDDAFVNLIAKAMMRDPSQRFQSAGEFIAAFEAWERGEFESDQARPAPVMNSEAAARGVAQTMATPIHINPARDLTMTPQPATTSYPGQTSPSYPNPNWAASHNASWAASQGGFSAVQPKSNNAVVIAVVGLIGIVVLGLASFLIFFKVRSHHAPEPAPDNIAQAPASEPPPSVLTPHVVPTEAPPIDTPVPPVAAAPADAAPIAKPVTGSPTKPSAPTKSPEPVAQPAPVPAPVAAPAPVPAPAAAPAPAPAPAQPNDFEHR